MSASAQITAPPRLLLIVSGSIAAYRALELVRLLRQQGIEVQPVMTQAATAFITPLSLEVLCGRPVRQTLFQAGQESEISHISLARAPDLVLVYPATANLMAKMAHGLADDLASTLLLATTAPVWLAPAMNGKMWENPATQANRAILEQRGVKFLGPEEGLMACGENGTGRAMAPEKLAAALQQHFQDSVSQPPGNAASTEDPLPLTGRHILVTAGPTVESIDPVRFLSNHSSGRQGYAIAESLSRLGARVTLVSGPVALPCPPGVERIAVRTAREMLQACESALPADAAVCVAAVSDWRPETTASGKLKKDGPAPPALRLVENPDILATLSHSPQRPALVVGFAAETDQHRLHGGLKLARKGCDWLLVNDVSEGRVFGGTTNQVLFLDGKQEEVWPEMSKRDLAMKLAGHIRNFLAGPQVMPADITKT
ncbi:bifunctional phosphopantothenoylcysteine decarboxylase/phosphopantothenate--cysteine ligase CoaBC [Oecophyllibacter saccharovorans]|uniref:bifunctional phosphopantothenoylcysteine decarboxylase/phosphopantothenate--cysteine ligase CoaBC n=1 Tax=Oecophyllibacter saccharovorans TaxID=2558360 RepID=UPI001F4FA859|nr:bifunctional phosphopantothenoylcysteine decarboxylase/phosphopantothenate--cysteine ligase CoaBC [Oecophyllibacter saccharovorans]